MALMTPKRLTILLLAAALYAGGFQEILAEEKKKENTDASETSLVEQAELKKDIFYWQLKLLRDVKLAHQELEKLRSRKLEILKTIEKLEFIARLRKKKDYEPEVLRARFDRDDEKPKDEK